MSTQAPTEPTTSVADVPTVEEIQRRTLLRRRERSGSQSTATDGLVPAGEILAAAGVVGNGRVVLADRESVCTVCGVAHTTKVFLFPAPGEWRRWRSGEVSSVSQLEGKTLPEDTRHLPCELHLFSVVERGRDPEPVDELGTRRARLYEMLRAAGMNPYAHAHASIEGFDTSECGTAPVRAVQQFAEWVRIASEGEAVLGLYLWGGVGVGKTHLAVAALRELLTTGKCRPTEVLFDRSRALVREIQSSYDGGGERTAEILARRTQARVWVLDDFGTEQASPDAIRHLTDILTDREGRPTLITSNLLPDDLPERHPGYSRIVSRLGDACFWKVEVRGRDRRRTP